MQSEPANRLNLKSPLLSPLPEARRPQRSRNMRIRLAVCICIPVLVWLLIRVGFTYPFYWLHDHILLIIKAHTFTVFLPTSWIWWGTGFVILGLGLLAFVLDEPLSQRLHLPLTRYVIHRRHYHGILVWWVRLCKRVGWRAQQLETMVAHERRTTLTHLSQCDGERATPQAVQERLEAAGVTTLLAVRLLQQPPCSDADRCLALAWLHDIVVWSHLHGSGPFRRSPLMQMIYESMWDMSLLLLDRPEADLPEALDEPPGFHMEALVTDLICHLSTSAAAAETVIPVPVLEHMSAAQWNLRCHRRMLTSIHFRRTRLDQIRKSLERQFIYRRASLTASEILREMPALPEALQIDTAGRLATTLAFGAAARFQRPELALAYVESVEALRFVYAIPPQSPQADRSSIAPLMSLLNQTPAQNDYRFLAQLAERYHTDRVTEFEPLLQRGRSLLTFGDSVVAQDHVNLLYQAAADARQLNVEVWE